MTKSIGDRRCNKQNNHNQITSISQAEDDITRKDDEVKETNKQGTRNAVTSRKLQFGGSSTINKDIKIITTLQWECFPRLEKPDHVAIRYQQTALSISSSERKLSLFGIRTVGRVGTEYLRMG